MTIHGEIVAGTTLAWVIVDRLKTGHGSPVRLQDSIETAFAKGLNRCAAMWEADVSDTPDRPRPTAQRSQLIDGQAWEFRDFQGPCDATLRPRLSAT